MSTWWHPDPASAFWQSGDLAGSLPRGPERPGDGLVPAGAGDGDPEPSAGVLGPPVTGAAGVTPPESPVRTFLPARVLTPAEEAEFRRDWENLDARAAAGVPGPPVIAGMIAPGTVTAEIPPVRDDDPPGTHRGQCQGCGLDDDVDIWSRCPYCAELAALRARNLPGSPLPAWWSLESSGPSLAWWWYLVPSVLGVCLGLIATWAVLYAIFYAL